MANFTDEDGKQNRGDFSRAVNRSAGARGEDPGQSPSGDVADMRWRSRMTWGHHPLT